MTESLKSAKIGPLCGCVCACPCTFVMSVHHVSIRFICLWILMWIMNAISGSLMSFCTLIEVSMFNVHLSQPTPTTVVFRGTTCACISKESWAKREEEKKLHYLECNDVITCEKPLFAVFHSLLSDSALLRDVGFLQTCWKPVTAGTSWSPW